MKRQSVVGLTSEEVARSRALHGENVFVKEKRKSIVRKFLENLKDPIIEILLAALVLEVVFTFGHCNLFEVFGIVAAILIATGVTTFSEHASAMAFEKLNADAMERTVRVIREGETVAIPSSEVVVGDCLLLYSGERVAADGVLVSGSVLVDQSALNGESREVEKRAIPSDDTSLSGPSAVFSGSVVTSGEGILHVREVGQKTYLGGVAREVQTETRISPLKLRLGKLASVISKIGYCLAALVAACYLFHAFVVEGNFQGARILSLLRDPPYLFSTLIHALTLMITVVVVAVPEGLPMMITVVLSANMKKMYRDGVLVKKPVGIETAGSMQLLFTDKTGTLTTGKLSLDRIVTPHGTYRSHRALTECHVLFSHLCLMAHYNTESRVDRGEILGGNGTDRAILSWFLHDTPKVALVERRVPFSSERKQASVTLRTGGSRLTLIKGAPEFILSRATHTLLHDGTLAPLDKKTMEEAFSSAASAGERVLGMGYQTEDGRFVFLCLAVLKDKLRSDVKATVRQLSEAGVTVVMMTGDSKETATAIATECGIYRYGTSHIVLDSEELSRTSDDALAAILPHLRVLARALPQDKSRLVRIAQREGLVVGMTGDGINDAPSLKLADVGFAMGSGSDIAKEAGDVVILDNSLSSIANTVLYGRTVFSSIRKFISFQLVMNLVACGISLFGQFIGIETPITVIQMLWVNLIMDTLGGLAFAGEAPRRSFMKEKPKRREEPILTREMLVGVLCTGVLTLALCLAFLKLPAFSSLYRGEMGGGVHLCAFYALFIFSGVVNALLARSSRLSMFEGLSENRAFLILMGFILVIQMLMIYFGGELFRTTPLLPSELFFVICLSLLLIPLEFMRRFLVRLWGRE